MVALETLECIKAIIMILGCSEFFCSGVLTAQRKLEGNSRLDGRKSLWELWP